MDKAEINHLENFAKSEQGRGVSASLNSFLLKYSASDHIWKVAIQMFNGHFLIVFPWQGGNMCADSPAPATSMWTDGTANQLTNFALDSGNLQQNLMIYSLI